MERFFDILFSGLVLLVLSPLLIPIVMILKFSGEGEVFFLQELRPIEAILVSDVTGQGLGDV
jgi:lipopolysaccharide/colanic/teichoic acid biosynthesis glycosyltransferase